MNTIYRFGSCFKAFFYRVFAGFGLLLALPAWSNSLQHIEVSIRPVALIVSELESVILDNTTRGGTMGGHAEAISTDISNTPFQPNINVLIRKSSPHHYTMTLSERARLDRADLLVWLGPGMEQSLTRAVKARQGESLALLSIHGLKLFGETDHEGGHHHDHASLSGHDPHIWLDLDNVQVIAQAYVAAVAPDTLSVRRRRLEAKLKVFVNRIKQLDAQVKRRFQAKVPHFIAYHETYTYLINRYALKQLGTLKTVPGDTLSARHLSHIKRAIKDKDTVCIFADAAQQAQAQRYSRVLEQPLVTLDLLARDETVFRFSDYFRLLTEKMASCNPL